MKKLFVLLALLFCAFIAQSQEKDSIQLKEIEINAHKAINLTPIPYTNLKKSDLYKNYSQEPSYLLSETPSITATADGGLWGYSYIRLRGIDQTRINFTLNGVPLNEPEDQGCYLSNYPDFFKSLDNIQIVRGSGLIKNGTSSFGGSINFDSYLPTNKSVQAEVGIGTEQSLKGSFIIENSFKNFKFYLQSTALTTDGFKDHSGNKSESVFLTTTYFHKKHFFKLIQFYGEQKNQLSWLGAPMDSILKDRTYNACSEEENDHYRQYHAQFNHYIGIDDQNSFNYTVYYNYLNGYYKFDLNNFLLIPGTGDVYKYWVNSNFVGANVNYTYRYKGFSFITGANTYFYNRTHVGSEKVLGFLYENNGYKNDVSVYVNPSFTIKDFTIYGNAQYRYTDYKYVDSDNSLNFDWNFINYTLGVEYKLKNTTFYYCMGKTNREATRNDILMGNDYLIVDTNGVKVYNNLKPESVFDRELGVRYNKKNIYFNINLYYMDFSNEISLNGQFGPSGLPLHDNVDNSFRSGIEFDFKYTGKWLDITNGSYYSYSKIKQQGVLINPLLTPNLVINQSIIFKYKKFYIGSNYRYSDGSYIDFSNMTKLKPYHLFGGVIGYKSDNLNINLCINNLFNINYFTTGALNVYGEPVYFIQQPRNAFLNILVKI